MATPEYTGIGGVRHTYGAIPQGGKEPSYESTRGAVRELVFHFDYANLPTNNNNGDALVQVIPANSLILNARLGVLTAAAGGTSYDIGLVQKDGTAVDADGLVAAAATASLGAGKWVVGAGALIGAPSATVDTQVKVTATGTFTAGKYKLVVTYIPLDAN